MLKIRLQRTGRKHEPTFRVVVTESQNSTKSGKALEVVGSYDPRKTNENLDADRIAYWISKGAQTSDTLHNLLVSKKIIAGKKVNVLPKKSPVIDPKAAEALAAAEAAKAAQAAEAEAPAAEETAPSEVAAESAEPTAQEEEKAS